MVNMIVAMDERRGIGFKNQLPWHLPEDLKRFSQLTKGHDVLMGRNTFESLPDKFRPLPKRKNIIATRNESYLPIPSGPDVDVCHSAIDYIDSWRKLNESHPEKILWIIGGEKMYSQTISLCDELYLTLVKGVHQADAYFPSFEDSFKIVEDERHNEHSFLRMVKK